MNLEIKSVLKWLFKALGYQLSRIPSPQEEKRDREILLQHESERLKRENAGWLRNASLKTILDVGANRGQSARFFRELCPAARILSFEPLPECYADFMAKFAGDPLFRGFNVALGSQSGKAQFHRNEFAESSSLLEMASLHTANFPQTQNSSLQDVAVCRLDDLAPELDLQSPMLIKLDVQGFESEVLAGGLNTIARADILIVEMSLETLYQGQVLFDGLYRRLTEMGFVYHGNFDQLNSPLDGRVLQVDGIFIKSR